MKRNQLIAVLLVVVLVAVLCVACGKTEQPQITVKVNGKEVKADGTVYAVAFANDVTKAVVEATATVGEIKGTGTFDLKEGVNEFTLTLTANNTETKLTVRVTRAAAETPADVTLTEVRLGDDLLTATGGKYMATVGYETDKVTIAATATDSGATVEGTGEKTLDVGKNEVTLTVKNGGESRTYTVEITREAPVLTLAEVRIGDEVLTAGADGVYTYAVANTVTEIHLTATATKAYVTVEGAGDKAVSVGENTFTIIVKLNDETKQEYTVRVTREAADLTLTEVKAGNDVLTATGRTYTYNVGNDVTEVTLAAIANNSAATVGGTGKKENLVVGENRFTITVSVGDEKAEYTVIVNRAKSSVKTIDAITVDGVTADYDAESKTYTITVGKYTANVVIRLTSDVSAYTLDEEIGRLAEGANEFIITVTAQDGTTETYTLVLTVVLPNFNVRYNGNIAGAVTNEGYQYKYGERQVINIVLGAAYTKSYGKIVVTYTVGNVEAKTVTLDENYSFTVAAEDAIGDIVVTVSGIEINTYTVTYHRNGSTTTETVEHGADAKNCTITPNTESRDVLDGYLYTHIENWMTEDGGRVIATLTGITKDMDVYYKDDVVVRKDVAYYKPMDGMITYYTIRQMNAYVTGDENGDVVFMVMIKSLATDGTAENPGKTSFVIYGTATWNTANELGVDVSESELNRWFTVKASAADKKVTVFRPDGSIACEKVFASYAADTISLAIHADAAVAAVNPEVPELCTITYLDEKGNELTKEKIIKGTAAEYTYAKPSDDLGDGYTREFRNIRWLDADGGVVNLDAVSASVTVHLAYDTFIISNASPKGDTKLAAINRFVAADENGIIAFRVRINDTGWAGFNILIADGNYVGVSGGVSASSTWYIITINTATGEITMTTEDGVPKTLDRGNYNPTATTLDAIKVSLSDGTLDVAAVNVELVHMEYYDTDKVTLLHSEWVAKGNIQYIYSSTDAEGYSKTISSWLPLDGSADKVYAASVSIVRNASPKTDTQLTSINKYIKADESGIITFRVRINDTGWAGFNILIADGNYVGVSGGVVGGDTWYIITINTATGEITMTTEDGTPKTLDTGNYTPTATTLDAIKITLSDGNLDIATAK